MNKSTYGARVRVIRGPLIGMLAVSQGYVYEQCDDDHYSVFLKIVHPPTRRFFNIHPDDVVLATDNPRSLPYKQQNEWSTGNTIWLED